MNLIIFFLRQCQRELLYYRQQPQSLLYFLLFFLMILFFFPLSLPPGLLQKTTFIPGLIWTAILLSVLLSSTEMFRQEHAQGVLEQWILSAPSLPLIIFAKLFLYWFCLILCLLLFLPFLALFFNLNGKETLVLGLSFCFATPSLVFLAGFSAAFMLEGQQKGALMAFILFPLALPTLIFASSALTAAVSGMNVSFYLSLLLALSLLSVAFLPLAIAALVRFNVSAS